MVVVVKGNAHANGECAFCPDFKEKNENLAETTVYVLREEGDKSFRGKVTLCQDCLKKVKAA